MEVFLYNSTVCRLCGEENDSGTLLYLCEENNQNLSEIINTYLPIKVCDDGHLPRTICPGCTIQLEATVEFLNLIINGQKVIRELYQREIEYKRTVLKTTEPEDNIITENIVYEINTNDGVYQLEHPVSLQVSGLEKPKRKRGRPPKKPKGPEDVPRVVPVKEKEPEPVKRQDDVTGKRRRKTPTRYREAVQGKELDRIFKDEGMIDEEMDTDNKKMDPDAAPTRHKEPEVIGHMATSGELVVVNKGKGRGRPKGRLRQKRSECAICGMEFSCVGRYMWHVAQHGPVRYQCAACADQFPTRLRFQEHQRASGHQGQVVLPADGKQEPTEEVKEEASQESKEPDSSRPPLDMPVLATDGPEDEASAELIKILADENKAAMEEANVEGDIKPIVVDEQEVECSEQEPEPGTKGKCKLKCPQCDKTFSSKQSKSLHIKAVHQGERPYACLECGVRFAYPRSLALHHVSHRRNNKAQDKRYACDLCGKVLNHPSSVVYHKEAEHAGQKYVCNKCGKQFKHKQLLQRHQLVHSQLRPYSCKLCNSSFKTKANLINHQLLHSGIKKFSCEICKHKFAHKTSLTLHMRWHTGSKPYVCKVCNKSFSQKGNLSEHERIHTGEKPYLCSMCPRRFTTSSQYRLHTWRHQPDRTYACQHCPKRFVTRGSWAAHVRRSLGARPHACAECGRAFLERWALAKHARTHTGERPFRCAHCPRTFADCSNLNKHKKQVHKQVSLLVSAPAPAPTPLPPAPPADGVIYVTYDQDDPDAYHILDPEQASVLEGAVLVPDAEPDDLQLQEAVVIDDEHIAVTDEQGNPLHFTMQDGTRLAITSADGKSLQVVTHDGQTIPVEINGYTDNEEEEVEETAETIVHQIDVQKDPDDVSSPTHYFTIV